MQAHTIQKSTDTKQAMTHRQGGREPSQAEAASVASGVDASEEQGGNLWEELLVRQRLPRLWVLGLQKEVSKGARLKLGGLDVLQQVSDDALQIWMMPHQTDFTRTGPGLKMNLKQGNLCCPPILPPVCMHPQITMSLMEEDLNQGVCRFKQSFLRTHAAVTLHILLHTGNQTRFLGG